MLGELCGQRSGTSEDDRVEIREPRGKTAKMPLVSLARRTDCVMKRKDGEVASQGRRSYADRELTTRAFPSACQMKDRQRLKNTVPIKQL